MEKVIPKLWKHQEEAVKKAMTLNNMFIFFDIGTGKSATAINICRQIYARHGKVIPTLILAPSSILRQWQKEFGIFSKIEETRVHAVLDSGKKRVANLEKAFAISKDCILILNYEALLNEELYKKILIWNPQVLISDECHKMKNERAKTSKKVFKIAENAKYRYGMTGTPVLKNALDLFMQFKIIDGGKTFGNNFFVYRSKYFIDKNAGWSSRPGYFPNFVPNPTMYPDLTAKVASISVQAKKEECIDLPEYIEVVRHCTMNPEQKKAYTEMERDFLTYLSEDHGEMPRAAVAQVAVSKSMKLLQIASGYVVDADGNDFYFAKNPKIDLLEEILEELDGKKVIIWAHFKANHKMIIKLLDKMKIKYVQIDGNATLKEKAERQELFETNPDYLVCLANQGAAGTGLNLKAAGYSIYYSKDYSYGKDEQSSGRNFRGGSIDLHKKVTRIDLIVEGTIEEKVMDIIKGKEEISNIILDWSKL